MADETTAESLEVFEGKDEQWYWHAKGGNGEIIAQGEGTNTRENATRMAEDAFPGIPLSVRTTINEPTAEEEAEAREEAQAAADEAEATEGGN